MLLLALSANELREMHHIYLVVSASPCLTVSSQGSCCFCAALPLLWMSIVPFFPTIYIRRAQEVGAGASLNYSRPLFSIAYPLTRDSQQGGIVARRHRRLFSRFIYRLWSRLRETHAVGVCYGQCPSQLSDCQLYAFLRQKESKGVQR